MSSGSDRDIYADTLAVFERGGPAEPLTTPEVADALGVNRRTVYKRLDVLVDRGHLETKSVGSRARVWWLPEGSSPADATRADRDRAPAGDAGPRDVEGEGSIDGVTPVVDDPTDGHDTTRDGAGPGADDSGRDRLDAVVRRVGLAAARADDRGDIARRVCEALCETDAYRVATIGELSPSFDRFRPEACVGAADGDLPMVASSEAGRSPTVGAAETGEVQVQSALQDDDGAWETFANVHGVRSFAAVPLVHDEALYGVLGVFAVRETVDDHRDTLAELGEIVGGPLYDRGHSEVLDPAVELEFRSEAIGRAFLDGDDLEATFSFDSAVPMADGTRLQYWTVRGIAPKAYRDGARQLPTAVNTRLLSTVGDTARFELRVAGPTMAAAFADHDGRLQTADIRDGAASLTGEFPRGVDVGSVVEAAREAQPGVELVARRNVLSPTYLRGLLDDELTDRQSTVLRLAYFGGYFDRPRGSSGGELADRLDITRQTFNHHLRAAEATMVRHLFERPAETASD